MWWCLTTYSDAGSLSICGGDVEDSNTCTGVGEVHSSQEGGSIVVTHSVHGESTSLTGETTILDGS